MKNRLKSKNLNDMTFKELLNTNTELLEQILNELHPKVKFCYEITGELNKLLFIRYIKSGDSIEICSAGLIQLDLKDSFFNMAKFMKLLSKYNIEFKKDE